MTGYCIQARSILPYQVICPAVSAKIIVSRDQNFSISKKPRDLNRVMLKQLAFSCSSDALLEDLSGEADE